MVDLFYKKLFSNLRTKSIFYKNNEEIFYYSDLEKYFYKFIRVTKFLKNKRNKICILSDKCFELYATSLSTLLSNNIWIPISTNYPEKRLFDIVNNVKPDLFIINQSYLNNNLNIIRFLKLKKISLLSFDQINQSKMIIKLPKFKYKKKDVAMIFFTSGSTGQPKGVQITNGGYIHSLKEQVNKIFYKQNNLIFGDYHDISFVISLNILLPCFYLKGTIVPGIKLKDILLPIEHISKNKINTLITVPTTINRIRNYYKKIKKKVNLRNLILCGEPFYFDLYHYLLKQNFSKNIYNCYGSTELSPWVFSHKLNPKDINKFKSYDVVPIGKKFKKIKTKIINNILYIGGPTLSKGYLNKKYNKLTFIKISGKHYYKTNDVVSILKRDYIIKGRVDSIVKISGRRIELFEIDSVLRKLIKVKNCLVFVKKISNYEQYICVAIETKSLKEKFIINQLKKKLPYYMIPKQFKIFKKFPINKNFKIDRSKIKNLF